MHLAIVNLTNGGMSGGYRKYLDQMIPRLAGDTRIGRIDLLSPADVPDLPQFSEVASHQTWPATDKLVGFPAMHRMLHKLNADVVLVPTARSVDPNHAAFVAMVRNMEPLLPNVPGHPPFERIVNFARRRAAHQACRTADLIIAVSDFVKQRVVDRFGVDVSRIRRVYHGVDPIVGARATIPASLPSPPPEQFLFVAGSIRPMRGIQDAIGALAILKDRWPQLTLVIAGEMEGKVGSWTKRLKSLVQEHGLTERVYWTGRLNADAMSWCFQHCAAFLMTSRMEACPNIALEAMSFGATIISNSNPPMPEFFGDSAIYYPAGDATRAAESVDAVLSQSSVDVSDRNLLARRRAQDFTWDRCAAETIEVLLESRRAASNGNSRSA